MLDCWIEKKSHYVHISGTNLSLLFSLAGLFIFAKYRNTGLKVQGNPNGMLNSCVHAGLSDRQVDICKMTSQSGCLQLCRTNAAAKSFFLLSVGFHSYLIFLAFVIALSGICMASTGKTEWQSTGKTWLTNNF